MKKAFVLVFLLVFSFSAIAILPEREYKFTPNMRGLKYSEYQVETIDNYRINVWEYALPDSVENSRTIIMVEPDAGNMGYMIFQAYALMSKGLRVISFDYRGFGHSQDFEIKKDFLFHHEFALDLDSVIKATRSKFPNDKVGLYSLSMGTYVSLIRNEKVDFIIAEGFYYNPSSVIERIKLNKGKIVLIPPHTKTIRKQSIPVLIYCADQDLITTTDEAKEFAKHNEVSIIEFKGDHLRGISTMTKNIVGDEYTDHIIDFLAKNRI